jgi:hypothetical protein
MEELDRLGWAAGFAITSYGVRLGIRATEPSALERLRDVLPPGWNLSRATFVDQLVSLVVGGPGPRPGITRFHLAYSGAELIARQRDLDSTMEALESHVHLFVAEHSRNRLFIHAGVVGWHGRAILIPGRTFTGKSTLVYSLVNAGASYYSDEYAVLDSQGRAHPFPRPLSLRNVDGTAVTRYPATALPSVGVQPLPVGLVIFPHYRTGARWRPRRLSQGQAILGLLANTVPARRHPGRALSVLREVVAKAEAWRGTRGEAGLLAEWLVNRF